MLERPVFGVAGKPEGFDKKSSVNMPEWLNERGLDAYEYQCGRGVNVGDETARRIGEQAKNHGIVMSLHSPYYVSLTNEAPDALEKNVKYLLASARIANIMGANRIVVHCGSAGKDRIQAVMAARRTLLHIRRLMCDEGFAHISLCPETMGKINQLGTLEETLELCCTDESFIPAVDFGHLYARSIGMLTEYADFEMIFDMMESKLGYERVKSFHIHFSKIEYSKGGEVRHLNFEDDGYGPDFIHTAKLIRQRGYNPVIICESAGHQDIDALYMKKLYTEGKCDTE